MMIVTDEFERVLSEINKKFYAKNFGRKKNKINEGGIPYLEKAEEQASGDGLITGKVYDWTIEQCRLHKIRSTLPPYQNDAGLDTNDIFDKKRTDMKTKIVELESDLDDYRFAVKYLQGEVSDLSRQLKEMTDCAEELGQLAVLMERDLGATG